MKKRMRSIKPFLRILALAGVCAALLAAGDKKKSADPDTVIAGTVFRDPGYVLPEATVTLVRRDDRNIRNWPRGHQSCAASL